MSLQLRAALLAAVAALVLGACGGASSKLDATQTAATAPASASPFASEQPTAGVTLPQRAQPDAARAMQHLQVLAGDIGSRPSTSENERRAADYIRQQLEAAGYQTSVEQFDVQATLGGSATLRLPDGSTVDASPLGGGANGSVGGAVVTA